MKFGSSPLPPGVYGRYGRDEGQVEYEEREGVHISSTKGGPDIKLRKTVMGGKD